MIRRATHADIPRLVAMGERFIGDVYPAALTFNGDALAALSKQLIDGVGVVFVAEHANGDVLGMIALIAVAHPMSGEMVATELVWWIDPEARGGRAALALLAEAEEWAKLQGATRLQMIAPNDKVCRFYERLGFEKVEVAYMRNL